MVRKKFAGQGNSVYEKGAEAIATENPLLCAAFFLVHHHAMVIL
jgi:hypothetical protein